MASDLAKELAAQAWCQPETSGTVMDVVLGMAFAGILDNWIETAAQNQRNTDFYRDLLDRCGKAIGPEAYVADDGSVMEDPIRLKIPEIVERLCKKEA